MLKSPLEKISEREAAIGNNKCNRFFCLGGLGPGRTGLVCSVWLDWSALGQELGRDLDWKGGGGGYWDRERSGLMAQIYDGRDDLID